MIKRKLIWLTFLIFTFTILILDNFHNIIYFRKFMKKFKNLLKKDSEYTEDKNYILRRK